jgi:hypothetical protein
MEGPETIPPIGITGVKNQTYWDLSIELDIVQVDRRLEEI